MPKNKTVHESCDVLDLGVICRLDLESCEHSKSLVKKGRTPLYSQQRPCRVQGPLAPPEWR